MKYYLKFIDIADSRQLLSNFIDDISEKISSKKCIDFKGFLEYEKVITLQN